MNGDMFSRGVRVKREEDAFNKTMLCSSLSRSLGVCFSCQLVKDRKNGREYWAAQRFINTVLRGTLRSV